MPKTIGIVGSRRRDTDQDFRFCLNAFEQIFEEGDRIVSGGCPKGGDRFAEIIARIKGATIIIHHADWAKYGRGAGFIRNTSIANDADVLIALPASDRTGGTEDTIKKIEKQNKEIIYV